MQLTSLENIVVKEENAHNEQFLLYVWKGLGKQREIVQIPPHSKKQGYNCNKTAQLQTCKLECVFLHSYYKQNDDITYAIQFLCLGPV